jgi:DNA polymerase III subunit delta
VSAGAEPIWIVRGADATLRVRALRDLVTRLLGSDDPSLALTELTVPAKGTKTPGGDDPDAGRSVDGAATVASILDACRTMPFGTSRRVVVLRDADALSAADAKPLAAYCAAPEPTAVLVLEYGEGAPPAALAKAAKAAGAGEVGGPSGKPADVLGQLLRGAPVKFDRDAVELVGERFGEDVGRVPGLIDVLVAAHGAGARLRRDDVEPYLGAQGSVPVFELTNAIDGGDVPAALATLARLQGPMDMHPLQVMAVLHGHYRRLLRLDDPTVTSKAAAVDALASLGGRPPHPFVAEKSWRQAQALGTTGLAEGYDLLATADRDLKGASRLDATTVMEVLVTRLASVSRRVRRSRPGAARSRA